MCACYNTSMRETRRNEPGSRRRNACKPDGPGKLLSFPGITEAIALVKGHAHGLAVEETMDAAARGELGDELRELADPDQEDAIDRVFEEETALWFAEETQDAILDVLSLEAGPKIAELWELSEPAGERLSEFIYWGTLLGTYANEPYWLPSVLVVNTREPKAVATLHTKYDELRRRKAIAAPPEGMKEGHIYLDVTHLPYTALSRAYEAVLWCRETLGIQAQDLREGAPPSIDGEKALKCAQLQRRKGSKEAARELGFPIYTNDNPSGSYPLFRKYSKIGRLMERRLNALDTFLYSLEDTLRST